MREAFMPEKRPLARLRTAAHSALGHAGRVADVASTAARRGAGTAASGLEAMLSSADAKRGDGAAAPQKRSKVSLITPNRFGGKPMISLP
jgi:hypothetical protein